MFFLLGIVLPWEFFRNTQRKHYLKAYWLLPVTVLSMWTALGLVLLLVSCCPQTWRFCIIIGRLQLQVLSVQTLKLNNVSASVLLPIFRLLFALICHVPVYSGSNTRSKAVTVLRWFDMEANFREKALLIQLQMGIWSFMQLHSMEQGPSPCH